MILKIQGGICIHNNKRVAILIVFYRKNDNFGKKISNKILSKYTPKRTTVCGMHIYY